MRTTKQTKTKIHQGLQNLKLHECVHMLKMFHLPYSKSEGYTEGTVRHKPVQTSQRQVSKCFLKSEISDSFHIYLCKYTAHVGKKLIVRYESHKSV